MSMTSEEIVALSKKHTIFEWTAQKNVAPIAVARAEGVYFWTPEGKRFIDFNSQLMSVNVGHGDRRVIEAIQKQSELVTYVAPSFVETTVRFPSTNESSICSGLGWLGNPGAQRHVRWTCPANGKTWSSSSKVTWS